LSTAWIQFDLGAGYTITEIRLLMYPDGRTYPIQTAIGYWTQSYNAVNPSAGAYWDQTIPSVPGQYVKLSMTAQNSAGTLYFGISEVQIFGYSTGSTPPVITQQPTDQTTWVGNPVNFSVVASGTPPLSYQWYLRGNPASDGTSSGYSPTPSRSNNGADIYVIVSNPAGSVQSNTVYLTVNMGLSVSLSPSNITVVAPAPATFSASTYGTPPPTLQWRKNGVNIPGATDVTYTTPATSSADDGEAFDVVATNAQGTMTSNQGVLKVLSWVQSGANASYAKGCVTVGTTSPGRFMLGVNGVIKAQQVTVTNSGWSDFVFKDGYYLKPLDKVEEFIRTNQHLEGIPTGAEVAENGVCAGEMQAKLLRKVEELSLYAISLKKANDAIKKENRELKEKEIGLEKELHAK
jgi:hypothetical protein